MSTHDQTSGVTRHGPLRAATWLILVVSVTANSVASLVAASTVVHVGLAAITTLSVTALVVLRPRSRR